MYRLLVFWNLNYLNAFQIFYVFYHYRYLCFFTFCRQISFMTFTFYRSFLFNFSYGSYARVAVSRTTGFTVTGNTVENAALIQFPQSTANGADVTHFSIVTTSSGAGQIILRGALTSTLPTSTGIQPQFAAGALTATID